jgi:renalase
MSRRIAVIGAGIAGLAAARRLKRSGADVTLFEKSRGVGGRMATRRIDDLQFDHGAQYFTATGDGFNAVVEEWRTVGHVAEWFDGAFVGTPRMTAPARAMAEGHPIVSACPVAALQRDRRGWSVHGADGFIETPGNGAFCAVILAVPAPQAVPLAAAAGAHLPGLEAVRYAPCWALMLAFAEPVGPRADRLRPHDDAVAWIARDAGKPGRRNAETFVIHASPDWSRAHLEWPADEVASALLARFLAIVGVSAVPSFSVAHRWRYALVEQAAGSAFLWDGRTRIGACGDWCLGPRVEAAFDSGDALGAAVLQSLEMDLVV